MAPKPDYLANKQSKVQSNRIGVPAWGSSEFPGWNSEDCSRIVSDDVANWQLNQNSKIPIEFPFTHFLVTTLSWEKDLLIFLHRYLSDKHWSPAKAGLWMLSMCCSKYQTAEVTELDLILNF